MVSFPRPRTTSVRVDGMVAVQAVWFQDLGGTPSFGSSLNAGTSMSISATLTMSSALSSAIQIFRLGDSSMILLTIPMRDSGMAVDVAPLSTVAYSPEPPSAMRPSSRPGRRRSRVTAGWLRTLPQRLSTITTTTSPPRVRARSMPCIVAAMTDASTAVMETMMAIGESSGRMLLEIGGDSVAILRRSAWNSWSSENWTGCLTAGGSDTSFTDSSLSLASDPVCDPDPLLPDASK